MPAGRSRRGFPEDFPADFLALARRMMLPICSRGRDRQQGPENVPRLPPGPCPGSNAARAPLLSGRPATAAPALTGAGAPVPGGLGNHAGRSPVPR